MKINISITVVCNSPVELDDIKAALRIPVKGMVQEILDSEDLDVMVQGLEVSELPCTSQGTVAPRHGAH